MKKEEADLLIEALRSGKYKQGDGGLRSANDSFCCLGVYCDIKGVEWIKNGDRHYYGVNHQELDGMTSSYLPDFLYRNDNGGFGTKSGYIRPNAECQAPLARRDHHARSFYSLAEMNDAGFTFEQIANVIEERYADL